jgi:hypothetical protein
MSAAFRLRRQAFSSITAFDVFQHRDKLFDYHCQIFFHLLARVIGGEWAHIMGRIGYSAGDASDIVILQLQNKRCEETSMIHSMHCRVSAWFWRLYAWK